MVLQEFNMNKELVQEGFRLCYEIEALLLSVTKKLSESKGM